MEKSSPPCLHIFVDSFNGWHCGRLCLSSGNERSDLGGRWTPLDPFWWFLGQVWHHTMISEGLTSTSFTEPTKFTVGYLELVPCFFSPRKVISSAYKKPFRTLQIKLELSFSYQICKTQQFIQVGPLAEWGRVCWAYILIYNLEGSLLALPKSLRPSMTTIPASNPGIPTAQHNFKEFLWE